MMRFLTGLVLCGAVLAKQDGFPGCGTHIAKTQEELFLHGRSAAGSSRALRARAARATNRDVGNIAVMDDSEGVIARRNAFTLDQHALAFVPSGAGKYKLRTDAPAFDGSGSSFTIDALGDDDTREVALPFSFPFFGFSYQSAWINSNGNLTFGSGDGNTGDYSLGRLVGGLPRVAPLFTDLDPSAVRKGAIRVTSDATRVVVTYDRVPLYSDSNNGVEQTFQVRLYPSGQIEFAYSGVSALDAVTGISPGNLKGTLSLIPLAAGSTAEFSGPVAEVYAGADAVDIAAAAQKFYATHEDSYDYLVFYNAEGVDAGTNALAYEVTVRNERSGYGDGQAHIGQEFGSGARLQSVLNLGPLANYPINPNVTVDLRKPAGDTPLTIIGHEAGHLFLAFASVRDPSDATAQPMLGRALVHWSFNFNSEASLLEGERIRDNGAGVLPRFTTTKTVEGYSPLDQYLMGFIAPSEVPPMFLVANSTMAANRIPQVGVNFNGARRDIQIDELIGVVGRRTPDSTVAQRKFRFGFVLITPAGTEPSADAIAQVEGYRSNFEAFYAKASGGHAVADTTLLRAVHTSFWPAAGVVQGASATATVSLDSPAQKALTIGVSAQFGRVDAPSTVTIAAGQMQASFAIKGVASGVEELTLRPADAGFETVSSRVQVQPSNASLRLELVSGNNVFRVRDVNEVAYSGVTVVAAVPGAEQRATTDSSGLVTFTYGGATNLVVGIEGVPATAIQITGAGVGSPITAVTNAASFAVGITPGAYATAFGLGFTQGSSVLVNGVPAAVSFANATQINFLAPAQLGGATAGVVVATPWFTSGEFRVPVVAVSPGIFAVVRVGTALEIYATGLNGATPTVTVGGFAAQVLYVGQPGYAGLDQVNVLVPAGVGSGNQPVVVTAGGVKSNAYTVTF